LPNQSLTLETYVGSNAVHRLPAAMNVLIKQRLNGHYYVTFTYPRLPDDDERYGALIERNHIVMPDNVSDAAAGQRFVIKSVSEIRSGARVYKQVEAHHVAFELGRYYLDSYTDFAASVSPASLLTQIGNNTPFTMAISGSFTAQDVWDFGEVRKNAALEYVRTTFEADLEYDNYEITLTTRAGANRGASVRYRKNLAGITRKSHDMERITRLYGYGKNGLTIEGYSGYTTKYIDSVYFDENHPYEGSVTFSDIDTQAGLLTAMQKHLREYELPAVSYDIDFVQLEKADPSATSDIIHTVGDTVTVYDDDLGYHFDARVTEYDRYPFEPRKARVTLANFRELTASDYVWKATVGGQQAIKYTNKHAVMKGVKYDDSITLVDGMGMAVSDDLDRIRVRLGQVAAGEYGMTLYNKAGTRTLWLDATTGDAVFAGNVIGASIFGSNFRTNAGSYPYVELSSDNNVFKAAKSASGYYEIVADPSSYASPVIYHTDGTAMALTGVLSGNYFSLVSGGNYDIGASSGAFRVNSDTVSVTANQTNFNSHIFVPSSKNLVLGGTSNLLFGSMTLSSILNSIFYRLDALEAAI